MKTSASESDENLLIGLQAEREDLQGEVSRLKEEVAALRASASRYFLATYLIISTTTSSSRSQDASEPTSACSLGGVAEMGASRSELAAELQRLEEGVGEQGAQVSRLRSERSVLEGQRRMLSEEVEKLKVRQGDQ